VSSPAFDADNVVANVVHAVDDGQFRHGFGHRLLSATHGIVVILDGGEGVRAAGRRVGVRVNELQSSWILTITYEKRD
jgi:hypothetical protein